MLSLPLEKKWQIWTSRRGAGEQRDTALSSNPETYTHRYISVALVIYLRKYLHVSTYIYTADCATSPCCSSPARPRPRLR